MVDGSIPQAHGAVPTAADQRLVVGHERDLPDLLAMATQRVHTCPGWNVPDPDRPIRTGGGQFLSVRPEDERVDPPLVAHQSIDLLSGRRVPKEDVFFTTTGQQFAI